MTQPSRFVRWTLLPALAALTGLALAWFLTPSPAPSAPTPPPSPAGLPQAALREPLVAEPQPAHTTPSSAAPSPWVLLNDEAIELLAEGDLEGAIAGFERCHEAEPGRPAFRGNLAEALVRLARAEHERGALAQAVAHLERASNLAPEREDAEAVRRVLERWRRELELGADDWTEGSERFQLSFDTDRRDLLHHSYEVLEHLERTYDDLVRWFVIDPFKDSGQGSGAAPIRVVLYEPEDFDRLTGLGDWAAGVFDGVVRVSVEDLGQGRWRSVLVHELVHAFLQALAPGTPGWLNEGLAQLLENRPEDLEHLRERLQPAELFPLEALTGTLAAWEDPGAIARAYAQSLVFVADLRRRFGDEALRRMVLGIGAGQSPAESFEAWTGVPLALAFQDWSAALGR